VSDVLHHLLELQAVDLRLNEERKRFALFPQRIAEVEARVAAVRAELEKSKAAQVAAIKGRKKYELDVEQWKDRARKYKDQSSQVKTNEAYKALQHEIESAEAEIAKSEDRLLEEMVASEEYDQRVKASEKALKDAEGVAAGERSQIEAEKTASQTEITGLEDERKRLVAQVPDDLLDHYERIARKHHGIALAEVRDEKCSACGMRVRPHVLQEMHRGQSEELFHCETCTRILYSVELVASAAAAAPLSNSVRPNSAADEL
jgi:predicted  nucleic acid-binding Zn-ribbon protein